MLTLNYRELEESICRKLEGLRVKSIPEWNWNILAIDRFRWSKCQRQHSDRPPVGSIHRSSLEVV